MFSGLLRLLGIKEAPVNQIDETDAEKIRSLEEIIGLRVKTPDLYFKALRHKSTLAEARYKKTDSYERLEFLGDAVLDLAVTEIIFEAFPDADEGYLTKLRAKIVKGESLAQYSRELGLDQIMEFGERTRSSEIKMSKSILADIFEAVVGAIYTDYGYTESSAFIRRVISQLVDFDEVVNTMDNHKSLLLEYTQAKRIPIPIYEVVDEYGPGHDKTFEIEVIIDNRSYGSAVGKSKKQAEQKAARIALEGLSREFGEE